VNAELPEPDTANRGLSAVFGKNARRLRTRAGLTLDQVSIAARMRGLNWSEARVADFESGRVAPNLATLIAAVLALQDAGCAEATFPELLQPISAWPIQINDSLPLWNEQVVNLLSGQPSGKPDPLGHKRKGVPRSFTELTADEWLIAEQYPIPLDSLASLGVVIRASGATEERTRKALGISSMLLANLSAAFWKRTFSQERDRRAGKGANDQKRGQVSRQMREELRAAIEAATHGDDQ
jgi:transcriptional regulator with XRE-family HTH domain